MKQRLPCRPEASFQTDRAQILTDRSKLVVDCNILCDFSKTHSAGPQPFEPFHGQIEHPKTARPDNAELPPYCVRVLQASPIC